MRTASTLICAILSGLLLAASMPPTGLAWLAWFCLVPLLAACQGCSAWLAWPAGLLAAASAAFGLLSGIVPVPHPMDGEPNWIFGGYLLFGILLMLMCRAVAHCNTIRFRHIPLLAALAVSLEAALMIILPVHLALSQYRLPYAHFLASFAGIWIVSYLLWVTNLLLAKMIRNQDARWWPVYTWVGLLAVCVAVLHPLPAAPASGVRAGLIQTRSQDRGILSKLNEDAAGMGAQIVVWPELSSIAMARAGDTRAVRDISARSHVAFVTGFEDAYKPKPHNVIALFDRGVESTRYLKRKPFAGEASLHTAGNQAAVVPWKVPVGLNICFDSCYPAVLRETVNAGKVGFIALPTEDPPSKNGIVQALHSAYIPFRAAELGVPIVRADITAFSSIVGSDGQTLGELGPGEGVMVRALPQPRLTLYRRLGDWFLYLCLLYVLGAGASLLWRRRRSKSQ
jgi:apolipoprotein N-acyltransferase